MGPHRVPPRPGSGASKVAAYWLSLLVPVADVARPRRGVCPAATPVPRAAAHPCTFLLATAYSGIAVSPVAWPSTAWPVEARVNGQDPSRPPPVAAVVTPRPPLQCGQGLPCLHPPVYCVRVRRPPPCTVRQYLGARVKRLSRHAALGGAAHAPPHSAAPFPFAVLKLPRCCPQRQGSGGQRSES